MLKAFHLGVVFAVVLALFAFILARPLHFDIVLPHSSDVEPFLADEGTVRSERSANISHIIGISRKIQLIVNKIMFLQISPDGTVNGTDNDNDYTILQRASINNHQIKIQGVVTCNYLCMDRCGLLYGSKEFTEECVFNEMMESHHFNTYSSAKYSNDKRTLYLALNKKGVPRKVQTKAKAALGRMETYTNVLTKPVSPERVEALALKVAKARLLLGKFLFGSGEDAGHHQHHLLRHHRYQFCPNAAASKLDEKTRFRCRKKEKRKKKRKCREDEDPEDDDCSPGGKKRKCEEEEDEEECQRRLHAVRQKRKSRNGEPDASAKSANEKDKKRKRRLKSQEEKTKKLSEKTVKSKCEGDGGNCWRRKGGKSHRKEKSRSSGTSSEDPATVALLWKDSLAPSASTDSTTEKPPEDYEEDDVAATDKMADDEEDDSTETDWTTPVPTPTPTPTPSSARRD